VKGPRPWTPTISTTISKSDDSNWDMELYAPVASAATMSGDRNTECGIGTRGSLHHSSR
jgi:hypothetical protein